MDSLGFRQFLQTRQLAPEQVDQQVAVIARFEDYLGKLIPPLALDAAGSEAALAFVNLLINEGANSIQNLAALVRYGWFSKNYPLYIATVELIDGSEAFENMHRRVGEVAGSEYQEEIFSNIPIPALGSTNEVKALAMREVMARLEQKLDAETQARVFSSSFRDLPDNYYEDDRRKYWDIGDIDRFLEVQREVHIASLEKAMAEGRLYFSQELTPEVIEFVRSDPEVSQGVRVGKTLFVTKIPYQAKRYLAETDPVMKRYYACHCPWARESIFGDEKPISAKFCQCSAGFHKRVWEVIFGKPLQADVLESVLHGDLRCRFAIHLPEEALTTNYEIA